MRSTPTTVMLLLYHHFSIHPLTYCTVGPRPQLLACQSARLVGSAFVNAGHGHGSGVRINYLPIRCRSAIPVKDCGVVGHYIRR